MKIPGRFLRPQPKPKLVIPAWNHRPPSSQTRGPPESPWRQIIHCQGISPGSHQFILGHLTKVLDLFSLPSIEPPSRKLPCLSLVLRIPYNFKQRKAL